LIIAHPLTPTLRSGLPKQQQARALAQNKKTFSGEIKKEKT